jgi:hypothetical protein
MESFFSKFAAFLFAGIIFTGCAANNFSHYTSPEITGRVLAADTHQPLANVRVQRPGVTDVFAPFGPPKGATVLMQPVPAYTDAQGRFALDSQSTFSIFRGAGWWSAPVMYEHSGYETFSTNYTAVNVTTNSPAGAPIVDAGDILLEPAIK